MKNRKAFFVVLIPFLILLGASLSFSQRGHGEVEKRIIEKFRRANPRYQKGKELFTEGDYKKSENELKRCLQILPQHADAYFLLSQIDYKNGNFEQALANMENAKTNYEFISQLYSFTHEERLEALRNQKMDLQSMLRALQDQLARATTQEEKQKIQNTISRTNNTISQINTHLNEPIPPALQIPAEYCYVHGNILFKLKKYQDAHDQYQETIKLNPAHTNGYNNLINLFFMAKNYQGALHYVNQAESNGVEVNPELKKAVLKAVEKKE